MQSNKDQAQSKMNKFKKIFLIYIKKKKQNPPAMQEIRSLGWKDPWIRKWQLHFSCNSSIPASEIPRTEQTGGPQSMGLQRVRHNLATKTMLIIWDYLVKLHIPYTNPKTPLSVIQSQQTSLLVLRWGANVHKENEYNLQSEKKKKTGNETNIHHNKIRCAISLQ